MTTLQDNLSIPRHSPQFSSNHRRPLDPWRHARPNISTAEQWTSVLLGSGLVLAGVRRLSLGGFAVAGAGAALIHRGLTKHSALYDRLGLDTAESAAPPEAYFFHGIHIEESCTINRDPMDLYRIWRDFENLPRFMDHVLSVTRLDDHRSHWVVAAPAGRTVEWDAEIINDEPGSLIAWRSLGGADVHNAGSVRFLPAPDHRGTELRVVIDYIPPAGRIGAAISRLLGRNPQHHILEDLHHFKQIIEAGEIPTTQGQPRDACRL